MANTTLTKDCQKKYRSLRVNYQDAGRSSELILEVLCVSYFRSSFEFHLIIESQVSQRRCRWCLPRARAVEQEIHSLFYVVFRPCQKPAHVAPK